MEDSLFVEKRRENLANPSLMVSPPDILKTYRFLELTVYLLKYICISMHYGNFVYSPIFLGQLGFISTELLLRIRLHGT